MNRNRFVVIFSLFAGYFASAQDDFSYRRKILDVSEEGWYGITLPADQFRHMKEEFQDLRLYTLTADDTIEVPYVIEMETTSEKRTEVKISPINRSRREGKLFVTFPLSGQRVNYIAIDLEEQNYFASVNLEGSHNQRDWFEIVKDKKIFSVQSDLESYSNNTIYFPTSDYKFLRAAIAADTTITFASASFERREVKEGNFEKIPATYQVRNDKNARQTIIDVKLNYFRPVSIIEVLPDTTEDFYRSLQISYLVDSTKTDKGWVKYHEPIHQGQITSFNENRYDVGSFFTQGLQLTINNFDNLPILVKGITVSGATVKLKAMLKPGEHYLYYGHVSLNKPTYDLKYFKKKIPAEVKTASLGLQENISTLTMPEPPLFENKVWLWSIMGLVIVVLGFFTIRMMAKKE